jgi:hypothetical protein
MSRGAARTVVFAALAGAALASGLMWYRMTFDDFDYALESWLLIPPAWTAPVLAAWMAQHRPLWGALLLMASSIAASWYFSDVFGFAPGALTFGVGLEHALRSVFGRQNEAAA